jgi:hypothetical protein
MKLQTLTIIVASILASSVSALPAANGTDTALTTPKKLSVDFNCGCWNDCLITSVYGGDIKVCPAVCGMFILRISFFFGIDTEYLIIIIDPRYQCVEDPVVNLKDKRSISNIDTSSLEKRGITVTVSCTFHRCTGEITW